MNILKQFLDKQKGQTKLFKNILNYGIGSILPQLIGFITLPIFSRHLSPDDYGTLEIIYYFNLFVTIIMRIGMPGVISRFYYDFGEGKGLKEYVSTVFWAIMCSSLFIGILAGIGIYYLQPVYLENKSFLVFGLIPIATAILNANTDIQRRLIQARQQSKYSMYLSFAISIIGVVIAYPFIVTFKLGATGSLLANLVITIVFFIQAQYYLRKDIGLIFKLNLLIPSIKYATGILPTHFINNLVPFLNRMIVAEKISVSALANFSLANRFGAVFILITGALQNAYLPQYFALRKEADGGINKIIKINNLIWYSSCAIALLFSTIGPYFIELLLPVKYHKASLYFPIFSIGFLGQIFYALYGQEIFYNKKTQFAIFISLSSIIPNVLVVLLFSNGEEAFSIAWGMTAGNICSAIVGYYLSSKYVKYNIQKVTHTISIITFILLLILLK